MTGAWVGILAGVGGLFLVFAALAACSWVLALLWRRRERRQRRARADAAAEAMDAALEALDGEVDDTIERILAEGDHRG